MKTGRVISLVLVAGITLLCSFPVFALDSYSYSKTNQDVYGAVNYYYSVNAVGSDSSVVADTGSTSTSTSSTVTGSTYVDYNFTVQVVNGSDSFLVADYNTDRYQFSIDVNTGNTAFFNLVNWSYMNSVLHYSDNMTVPSIAVGTNTGHIVFSWYDVDSQIILCPYETRTYSFTIRSTTDFGDGVNYPVTPYTAEGMTYFPSGSSFSLSKKPTSFTAYSDNTLVQPPSSPNLNISSSRFVTTSKLSAGSQVAQHLYFFIGDPVPVDSSMNYIGPDIAYSNIYRVPLYYSYRASNLTDLDLISNTFTLLFGFNFRYTSNYSFLGSNLDQLSGDFILHSYNLYPNQLSNMRLFPSNPFGTQGFVLPSRGSSYSYGVFYYYFGANDSNNDPFSINVSNFSLNSGSLPDLTFSELVYETTDLINDIHETEESYYSSTNTALGNTGLDSYQYDVNQTDGLGLVAQDFTLVWNALGPINGVIIFSMTLSLALFVLRHRRRI